MKRAIKCAVPLLAMCLSLGLTQSVQAQRAKEKSEQKASPSTPQDAKAAERLANKETVFAFYGAVARADFETARKYVGEYYIEHDPERYDGLPGLQRALDYNRRTRTTLRVIHELAVADGDYVTLYSHVAQMRSPPAGAASAGGPGGGPPPPKFNPVADIFRLADGKIVEHWNAVLQSR